jgi:hypothetical protein
MNLNKISALAVMAATLAGPAMAAECRQQIDLSGLVASRLSAS